MKPWRSYIPAILRRYWFWLTVSLLGNALVWLVVFNQTASLRVDAPQSLFGFPISYDASMAIAMMLLAGMFFFGLMLLATVLYPLFYFLAHGWGHHPPVGFCADCGYDLRATPDRCPECGKVPSKKVSISN